MKRPLDYFVSNFSILVFNITYTLSVVLIYLALLWILPALNVVFLALISLAFLFLVLFLWAYLHTLFTIPQKLAGAYDTIKNALASNQITDLDEYARTLTSFMVSFFDFSFLDIRYTTMQIGNTERRYSSDKISGSLEWSEAEMKASSSPAIIRHGTVRIDDERFRAYTIPVWFAKKYLGFFTVFSKQRLGPVRLRILTDLEDNYIDDQVIFLMGSSNFSS